MAKLREEIAVQKAKETELNKTIHITGFFTYYRLYAHMLKSSSRRINITKVIYFFCRRGNNASEANACNHVS